MKRKYNYFLLLWLHFFAFSVSAQEVTLYEQFNGRYDFTFIGNTLNLFENNNIGGVNCEINTSSAATLDLQPTDVIEKAYLYWAGSGPGDFDVKLNDVAISPERTFSVTQNTSGLVFFSAFKDITSQVLATGNGDYTLSELDLTAIIPTYCGNGTNFAGWAILIVYRNDALPLNQLNVYDGLDYIGAGQPTLDFTLDNLNVIDDVGAKIGFIAWEGDTFISVNETLRINGEILSNPPLNPANNAFNGTNSITGSNELFNMDLDIYPIQDNIQPGDQSAEISLTSGQDFVMINTVVTKLNSQVPDATIVIDDVYLACDLVTLTVDYTVSNFGGTNPLPANTPIAVYADTVLVATTATTVVLAIDESESGTITFELPAGVSSPFELLLAVDDTGNGTGVINELNENNNTDSETISLLTSTFLPPLTALEVCNEGFGSGTFSMNAVLDDLMESLMAPATAYASMEEAMVGSNPIINTGNYQTVTPQTISIRVDTAPCPTFVELPLLVENCPPTIYNYISANGDGLNDFFFVDGLRDIFLDFEIQIYNRWGKLLWTGNQNTDDWRGEVTTNQSLYGSLAPDGTYFYVLYLNDTGYPEAYQGFVYITRS
jgi:gliding motility-associated-like protein